MANYNRTIDENNLTSSKSQEIRRASLQEELRDSVTSGEGYSIAGDLTDDVLTEGSAVRHDFSDENSDLANVAESKDRGELTDDIIPEDLDIKGDNQPEST